MDDLKIAKKYVDAFARRDELESLQREFVLSNIVEYNRFYDLAAKFSHDEARELAPKEAAIVDEIEAKTSAILLARNSAYESLGLCMIEKMKQVCTQPVDRSLGVAQLLIDALQEVNQFRLEYLDHRESKFDMVISCGHGFQAGEKDRLINRLVSTWAKASRVQIKVLKFDVQNWIKGSPSGQETVKPTFR